jgi:hypothetical protein
MCIMAAGIALSYKEPYMTMSQERRTHCFPEYTSVGNRMITDTMEMML